MIDAVEEGKSCLMLLLAGIELEKVTRPGNASRPLNKDIDETAPNRRKQEYDILVP